MKTSTQSTADMLNQLKHQNAQQALIHARSILERAQIMNWALHYLTCNILPNVRLDLIANAQAELSQPDRDSCRSD